MASCTFVITVSNWYFGKFQCSTALMFSHTVLCPLYDPFLQMRIAKSEPNAVLICLIDYTLSIYDICFTWPSGLQALLVAS